MERERITISIKKQLLKSVDGTIDGINIRNRSHAIENLITQSLKISDTKNAVILVGGNDAIKMIPSVKNNLSYLAEQGFNKVYIAVGFLANKIKERLGDGEDFGLELEYTEEGEGSAGAILSLKKKFKDTFIVLNGEVKAQNCMEKMIETHKQFNPIATIGTDNIDDLSGIYILEPEVFKHIPKEFAMLEQDIFPKLFTEGKAICLPV